MLNEKVMGSCKQVRCIVSFPDPPPKCEGRSGDEIGECIEVFNALLKYPKCFTETNRVKPHYYVAITKFESLLLSR